MKKIDYITDWLSSISSDIIPPFCLEIILKDYSHHFIHSVSESDEKSKMFVLRIWDFRELNESSKQEIKQKLTNVKNRKEYLEDEQKLHPKLDWANLRIRYEDILYCIEWHDKLYPDGISKKIGF